MVRNSFHHLVAALEAAAQLTNAAMPWPPLSSWLIAE